MALAALPLPGWLQHPLTEAELETVMRHALRS